MYRLKWNVLGSVREKEFGGLLECLQFATMLGLTSYDVSCDGGNSWENGVELFNNMRRLFS